MVCVTDESFAMSWDGTCLLTGKIIDIGIYLIVENNGEFAEVTYPLFIIWSKMITTN
jgi:hypothetical protein